MKIISILLGIQRLTYLAFMAVSFLFILYSTFEIVTSRQSPMYAIAAFSMLTFFWLLWLVIGFQYFKFTYKKLIGFDLDKKDMYSMKFNIEKRDV